MPPSNIGNSQINMLIDSLIVKLFEAEHRRLRKNEQGLVALHKEASGSDDDGFIFRGQFYTDLDQKIMSKGRKSSPHPSLVPKVLAHIQDRKDIAFDKQMIKQALVLTLAHCRSRQDVRDALPNVLGELVPECKDLPRTRPEGFGIENHSRKSSQYEKLREKIEFYAAARLLY